jgi:hypothetical protein
MASRLWDATEPKPQRFDLTMSRRTRRTASSQADQGQVAMEGSDSEVAEQHKASEQAQEQKHCHKDHRRVSLQELIQDEALDGEKAGHQEEDNAFDAAVHRVPEAAADSKNQAAARKMVGIVRRYVRVRSIRFG